MHHFFINELSLQGQYYDAPAFVAGVVRFISLTEAARATLGRIEGRFWRSKSLSQSIALRTKPLVSVLGLAKGELLDALVDVVFNRTAPASWEDSRLHGPEDIYICHGQMVTETSVAELAARRGDCDGALINFHPSVFCPGPISVHRDAEMISLDSFDDETDFTAWVGQWLPPPYAESASTPPTDEQTCLVDPLRFARTSILFQARHVFRHIVSGDRYYVDNLHFGRAAHLEVFDRFGRHRGEASLEGQLRPKTADKTKKLP